MRWFSISTARRNDLVPHEEPFGALDASRRRQLKEELA